MYDPTFYFDKARNVLYEGFLEDAIRLYWALRGRKATVYENPANDQIGREAYDRRDTFGILWECKTDLKWGLTGNVFLEIPHEHSQADMFVVQSFFPAVMSKSRYWQAINSRPRIQAGWQSRAEGVLVKLEELRELDEMHPQLT